ncbi:MAG: tetratricopeptide repeat protein [Thermoanaerobaculia bacterium]
MRRNFGYAARVMGMVPLEIETTGQSVEVLTGSGEPAAAAAPDPFTWPLLRDAAQEPRPVEAGDQLGPYRLLRVLGRGGMGVVYLAHEAPPIQRLAAVKVLRPTGGSRRLRKRLETEVRALARLSHPNIAQVFAAGHTADGSPYFALEYVPGLRIDEYCNQERLTLEQRIELFLQLCNGVRYAHLRGVLHRDLKPSNVLVTEIEGRRLVKIIDFSIAASLVPTDGDSAGAGVAGTPGYMSPEARRDQTAGADPRSDVYSLGVVLYLLLSGLRPFPIDNRSSDSSPSRRTREVPDPPSRRVIELPLIARENLADKRRQTSPRELAQRLRGDLDAIVLHAMDPVRSNRYPSVQALIDDLHRHLEHRPVEARPLRAGYRASCFVRRNRKHLPTVLLAGATLSSLLALGARVHDLHRSLETAEVTVSAEREASEFLEGLLSDADGVAQTGVSAQLERARRRAEDLDGRPIVQARLYQLLGRAQMARRQLPIAADLLEDALRIQEAELGPTSLAAADTASDLCRVYGAQARSSRAVDACRHALELRRSRLGDDALAVGDSYGRLALALEKGGAPSEAASYYERAVDVHRIHRESRPEGFVEALLAEAAFLRRQGQLERAQGALEEALSFQVGRVGSADVATVPIREALATVHADAGRLEDARLEYLHGLQVLESAGSEAGAVPRARLFERLAELDLLAQRLQEATLHASRALEILRDELSPVHPAVAEAEVLLGRIELAAGDPRAASLQVERALKVYEVTYGPDALEAAVARLAAGDIAAAEGDLGVARRHYETALLPLRQLRPEGRDTARGLCALGAVLRRQGSLKEARRLQQEALSMLERRPGLAQLDTGTALRELGRLSMDTGNLAEAQRFLERALMLRTALLGASDPDVVSLRAEIAALESQAQVASS